VRGIVFPTPGYYQFTLLVDGEWVAHVACGSRKRRVKVSNRNPESRPEREAQPDNQGSTDARDTIVVLRDVDASNLVWRPATAPISLEQPPLRRPPDSPPDKS
jgi:hypothetical protein